jgi:hypothetical protein
MTIDHDLRDLLTAEADGPVRRAADWDTIVRRGHHRRRVGRLRNGIALGGVAAMAAVGAFALTDRDHDDRTGVVVDQPHSTTTSTVRHGPGFYAARVQGVFLTILFEEPSPDLCDDHPRVTESATEVVVEVVPATFSSGEPWAGCQTSALTGRGMIELSDPLGDRRLVDAYGGAEITVIDGAPLLFPTALPDGFDLERWDELQGPGGAGPEWTFRFTSGDQFLSITTSYRDYSGDCGEPIDVRGRPGCRELGESSLAIRWQEGPWHHRLEGGDSGDGSSFTLGQLVVIAEGLEPLGG